MRRLLLLLASAVVIVVGSVAPSLAGNSAGPHDNAGQESQNAAAAADWFTEQRLAPNAAVNPDAFAAVSGQVASLPVTAGTWKERTNLSGAASNDFSDSPTYIDPTSNFSNSGAGDRSVAGRMTSLAAAPDGSIFAGAADGGVWKTSDGGATWSPLFDTQGTLSIGALLVVGSNPSSYTVYAGTGEANTSSDSYAGIGVLASTNGGSTWHRVGGTELNGALVFRLAQDGTTIFAATSHGLYSFNTASSTIWTAVLQPAGQPSDGKNFNLVVGNMITDVVVRPGTSGSQVLAVAGWRGGAPTNGLYLSTNGGATGTFAFLANPQGWVPAKSEGRTTIAYSTGGDRAYAIVQSPVLLNVGTSGQTLLQGVYESTNGDPNGPWTKIADALKLASSDSALFPHKVGKGFQPGIQAWYNQFLAVDPGNKDHLYLGLEEVYETLNAGAGWDTVGRYWNFGFSCFSYSPFEGTCNHQQAHSDQHAALIAGGKLYIGNDGGVYSRSLDDRTEGAWADLNPNMDALQYYGATESASTAANGGSIIYGGLQDNGSNKVFTSPTNITDDNGNQLSVSSVQVFGGDGGYTIVDPSDSNKVLTEYVDLTALSSIDGGKNWNFNVPPDQDPRFIAPIAMDRTNSSHLVAGGAVVWNTEGGIAKSMPWTNIFDVRTATGANAAAQVTALDAFTAADGTQYVAAAWCGFCNSSGFHSGVVMLSNSGGTWHATSQVCTGASATCAAAGLPKRYVSGVRIDKTNPNHAYLTLSGFSRRWLIGPGDDPGVGHVFESTNAQTSTGSTWSNISAGLPDVPMDDVVFRGGILYVATDFGVFRSADDGATWTVFGSNLPNVVVDQLTEDPDGNLVAATHGRGVWTIKAS